MPGDDPAGRVQSGPHIVGRDRPQSAIENVVLPRPHHFDWTLASLGQQNGVDDVGVIAVTAPAEAAAEQGIMQGDLFAGDAKRFRCGVKRHRRALRSAPHFRRVAVCRYDSDRVQRLHLGVVGIVATVLGFDHSRCGAERGFGIPLLEPVGGNRNTEIAGGGGKVVDRLDAVKTPGPASAIPADGAFDRRFAVECGPRSLREDADAMGQAHGRNHPRYDLDLAFVKAAGRAAVDRAGRDGSVDHPRHLHVDRIYCRAIHFAR